MPDAEWFGRQIQAIMDGVNAFGADPAGGWSRLAFNDADMAARRWLCEYMAKLGLDAEIDAIGNVIGRWGPSAGPVVMVGSHTDTVARGGAFDGVFGVAAGVAAVMALNEMGVRPTLGVEVVNFADEEGRFGGMLGSQALVGAVDAARVGEARDVDGLALTVAMAAQGLDPARIVHLRRRPGSVRAFLEAHVEQGPVLEKEGVFVGIAPSVTGVCVTRTRLTGQADHSGTTPMDARRDALAAAAEAIAAIPQVLRTVGAADARATVGKLTIAPNAPHTIPGSAEFTAVLRDADAAVIDALERELGAATRAAAARHGVDCTIDRLSYLAPVALDDDLAALAARSAEAAGLAHLRVPSGAGHDAQTMQALCRSALLFAPSRGGISHAPQEHTDLAAMAAVTSVLTRMLKALVSP